jgi:hypothetical protein
MQEHNNPFDVLKLIDDLITDGIMTSDYRLTPHADDPSHASAA